MRGKKAAKGIWSLLKQAFTGFSNDKVLKLSASLAYYTVFSLGPMIIVVIFFADIFWGRDAVEGTIYGQIKNFVGADAALQLQQIIKNAAINKDGYITAIIGFISLLFGATGIFAEIQDSINGIWGLKPKPQKGWLKMLLNRLLSFSIVVSLGFLLLVSLIINGIIDALNTRLTNIFPELTVIIFYVVNLAITFIVTTLLFAIIFKVLPDALIKWKDVLVGAMATAGLFMLGKFAITFYIGNSRIGNAYGAAGSLVVILLWIYYSSVILYFGAEFTKAYAARYGAHIYPSPYAVWVKQIEVEDERGSLKQVEQKKRIENENSGDNITIK